MRETAPQGSGERVAKSFLRWGTRPVHGAKRPRAIFSGPFKRTRCRAAPQGTTGEYEPEGETSPYLE